MHPRGFRGPLGTSRRFRALQHSMAIVYTIFLFIEGRPILFRRSSTFTRSDLLPLIVALATLFKLTCSWDMSTLVRSVALRRGGSTRQV